MPTFLMILLSLALTACSSAPVTSIQSSGIPPTAMLTLEESPICYTVEMRTWEEVSHAEDGTPLVSYCYTLPVLQAEREDGTVIETAETEAETRALAVTEAFNEQFASWTAEEEFEGLTQEAQADLEWRRTEQVPWTKGYVLELDCSVYQTEELVSVTGAYYSHLDGAAHPNTLELSWNFDLTEGEFFEPDFLAEGTGLQEAVTEEIIRQANVPLEDGTVPADSYWADYPEIAANWSTTSVSFDSEGMVVTFSPYELAAYGFGPQVFRIPYDCLEPYLSDHGQELLGLTES